MERRRTGHTAKLWGGWPQVAAAGWLGVLVGSTETSVAEVVLALWTEALVVIAQTVVDSWRCHGWTFANGTAGRSEERQRACEPGLDSEGTERFTDKEESGIGRVPRK